MMRHRSSRNSSSSKNMCAYAPPTSMTVIYWLDSFGVSGSACSNFLMMTGSSRRSLVPSTNAALSAKKRSHRVKVKY